MKQKYQDDLFQDTTMTFGEHLEELRGALLKALVGLLIGCVVGFFVGDYVVAMILGPLEKALGTYYSDGTVDKYETWKQARLDAGLPVPYTSEQIARIVKREGMLFDIVMVDPAQVTAELERADPKSAGSRATPSDSEGATPAAGAAETPADESTEDSANRLKRSLLPVFTFHPAAEDARIKAKSFSFPETFGIWLKASLVVGAVLSSPWVFYQIWAFVAAGLYPHEKRYVHLFLPFSLGLFLLGAAMAYLFVFQPVLNFLLSFNNSLGIDPDPRISEWLTFVLLLPLGFGISFQLPLVMLFLERIGIFDVRAYLEKWRISILVIFVLSAILTPADPYSLLLMALPLTVLYFGGVLLCWWLPKGGGHLERGAA